jgi:hypothetical protein
MWIHLLPLGLIDGAGSGAPVQPDGGNTPGFIGRIPGQFRVEDEETKRKRREGYESKRPAEPPIDLTGEYLRKSAKLARALTKATAEQEALRAEIEALRAKETARAQAQLLRKQQALQLAAVREALIREQIEVIDVAYVAAAVLTLQ